VVAERREVTVHRAELRRRDRHLVRPRPRRGGGQGSRWCGPLLRRRRVRVRRGGHRGPGARVLAEACARRVSVGWGE
jgi:hypothetical protein